MALPFTVDQFFGVFRAYNEAVWPAQIILVTLAVVVLIILSIRPLWSDLAISAILAFLWAWMALIYHLTFFASINPLAYAFAALSALGSLMFLWHGVIKRRMRFRVTFGPRVAVGAALVVFALILYPAWSVYAGHSYPAMPTFGLPCPTTIFTIGVLAFLIPPYPRGFFLAPVLWCLVGAQAAFLLDIWQDLGLLLAAAVGVFLMVRASVPTARVVL